MISSKWLWRMTASLSLLVTLLFIFGFAYAVRDMMRPVPSAARPPQNQSRDATNLDKKNQIQIVALGDSLTKGTGDANGKGYVYNVKDLLVKKLDKPAFVLNDLGINGYRTDQLLNDLNTKPNIGFLIKQADIVLLTIGANDLFGEAREKMDMTKAIDAQILYANMPKPLSRLKQILGKVSAANPKAKIIYVGLYNPFGDLDETKKSSEVIQKWNLEAFNIANRYSNVTVVPTFDLFDHHLTQYLFTDHFHPNSQGYEKIAERIVQDLP